VERSSVAGAAAGSGRNAPFGPDEIARLREACGVSLVLAWHAGDADGPRNTDSSWAEEVVSGLFELVGRISLAAASAGEAAFGDLAGMRRSAEAARTASHDLSQPLTTIVARSHLLLESMTEVDPGYRPVSIISQEAERLARALERMKEVLPPRAKT
jgi:signal transduction histidine kinase